MIETIKELLKNNPWLSGTGVLLFGGSALAILWRILGYIRLFFAKIFFVEIHTVSNSDTFYYLQHWLNNTSYAKRFCSNLLVTQYSDYELYQPSYGNHVFFSKGRLYYLNYTVEPDKNIRTENIHLSIFRIFGKRKIATAIIEEGKRLATTGEYNGTNVYVAHVNYWEKHLLKKNSFVPILTDEKDFGKIGKDIENFLSREKWYVDKGINYKRGYLFAGPPGNGKTSAILSIAQKFKKDLCILNLGDEDITEKDFLFLISHMPANAFLCVEDVDATSSTAHRNPTKKIRKITSSHDVLPLDDFVHIKKSKSAKATISNNLTLSTILNTFDGLYTPHGLVFFMTSNYPERLDSALIRKGRIDYRYDFENTNHYQATSLYDKYFDCPTGKSKFIDWSIGKPMSETHSKLIEHKDSLEDLIEDLNEKN